MTEKCRDNFCSHPLGCWLLLTKTRRERGQLPGDLKAPEAAVTAANSAWLIPAPAAGMLAAKWGTMGQPLAATARENTMSGRSQPALRPPGLPGGNAARQQELDASLCAFGAAWGFRTQSKPGARSSGARVRHLGWAR